MASAKEQKDSIRHGSTIPVAEGEQGDLVNASGHVQELDRNFNLLAAAGVGLVVGLSDPHASQPHCVNLRPGNVWPAVGGSILVAIFNGGPPGVIYEFITVSVFYWIVAASIAELASAIPSSGGVYHWASVTPGKRYGRIVGYVFRTPPSNDMAHDPLLAGSLPVIGTGLPGCLAQRR